MSTTTSPLPADFKEMRPEFFGYSLELADDLLILGHRLSEWCGRGPMLEEDIALSNIALDCLGQAKLLLELAAEFSEEKTSADALAFFREATQFKNSLLVEQANGDFANTMLRQLFFDSAYSLLLEQLLNSPCKPFADFAAKAQKEIKYHLRHARNWVDCFGNGTEESRSRLQNAVENLWPFTHELFTSSASEETLAKKGIVPARSSLRSAWESSIAEIFSSALLPLPKSELTPGGGRTGFHTEFLGHLLAEMQITARSHPGADW